MTRAAAPAPARMAAQARWETLAMIKNGEQLVLILFMPVLALVALTHMSVLDGLGGTRISAAAPGVLALGVLSTAFTGQGIATGFDRRYGVLTHAATTPLGRSGLLAGKLGAVLVVVAAQVVLLGGLAALMGFRPAPGAALPTLLALVLGAWAFTAIGLFIAGLIRPEATLAVTNLLWIVFAAAGGILIPAATMPSPLDAILPFLPTAALADALRAALLHGAVAPLQLLVLVAWGALCSLGVVKTFSWTS
ncbi:ABC transporter permease [Falsarthrobacter nasiphocae]|uniref:ABC-2 type transport system permease protein n=1 Tax=Falsarthrobacter nasiphocae TaxID=189863 RepID=A0AAE3YDG3_9MICC|nr:ABC transporter permease [Falsarthrobacter nasiphocae]MDR6891150.1 ABC-2 type transport system permease protein [Falsarthrobacter nasiphocae]